MIDTPLPPNIERQLLELEARHKSHSQMLEDHREAKARRREEHRARHFQRSTPPNTLV